MLRSFVVLLAGLASAAFAPPRALDTPTVITTVSREMLDNLPVGSRLEDLLATCPAKTVPTVIRTAPALPGITASASLRCMQPDDIQMIDVLADHNRVRTLFGSRPLAWDPVLAAQARSYGPVLAQYDRPVHSPRTGRDWSRENLVQALRGTPVRAMVGVWTAESRYFRPGVFPNVSTTGNWADVGHFTQMVWPKTTTVGCAVQRGIGRSDWLICRYAPPGNRDGVALGAPPPLPTPPPPAPPPPPPP